MFLKLNYYEVLKSSYFEAIFVCSKFRVKCTLKCTARLGTRQLLITIHLYHQFWHLYKHCIYTSIHTRYKSKSLQQHIGWQRMHWASYQSDRKYRSFQFIDSSHHLYLVHPRFYLLHIKHMHWNFMNLPIPVVCSSESLFISREHLFLVDSQEICEAVINLYSGYITKSHEKHLLTIY